MWEHTLGQHSGVTTEDDYVLVVTSRDRDPVRRVMREAVVLRRASEDKAEEMATVDGGALKVKTLLMNDKTNEWFGPWLMTATMTDL